MRACNLGRHKRPGEPCRFTEPTSAAIDRFLEKVAVAESGCWLWQAEVGSNGYGRFWFREDRMPAHRFAHEHYKGPTPEGWVIDHLCRVPTCVNPDHLEAVTHGENVRRGDHPERRKTHCKWGHPFTEDNILWRGRKRRCRRCIQDQNRRAREGRSKRP